MSISLLCCIYGVAKSSKSSDFLVFYTLGGISNDIHTHTHTHTHTHIYIYIYIYIYIFQVIYIYIYIYIYCYLQTECFVAAQLFSVAWNARCFKRESKPSCLYVSRIFYSRAVVILCISEGIFLRISFNIYAIGYLKCLILEKSYCASVAGKFHESVLKSRLEEHIRSWTK